MTYLVLDIAECWEFSPVERETTSFILESRFDNEHDARVVAMCDSPLRMVCLNGVLVRVWNARGLGLRYMLRGGAEDGAEQKRERERDRDKDRRRAEPPSPDYRLRVHRNL